MIVKMKKVFLVARAGQREALLEKLRELGVVHLAPVAAAPSAPEELDNRLSMVRRAQQVIEGVQPSGEPPEVDDQAAVEEILAIARRAQENRNRLIALGREAALLGLWGELRREQLDALAEAGVPLAFYSVARDQLDQVSAECVAALTELPGRRMLVAVVQRQGQPGLPEDAQPVETPARGLPTVRTEAKELEAALANDAGRLAQLANLADAVEQQRRALAEKVEFARALAGAMAADELFAVQGWVPRESAETLDADLAARELEAAVQIREPTPAEEPPTLIGYPRWARPIKGLFDILGTFPGYREFDVSGFFMIALPVFAAMLIGDAGYGLIFLLSPLLFYRKAVAAAGAAKVHLIMVVGAVALVWGVLTGNMFGVTPGQMMAAGSLWAFLGRGLDSLQLIRGELSDQTAAIMKLSFLLGTIHLSVAQLRQALRYAPSLKFLSHVGWAAFLWGMLGLVWFLFFGSQRRPPEPISPVAIWLLLVGGAMAILFAHPSRNPAKMIGFGLASFPLAAVGTFSDTISYIRLMAVGMASTVIGQTFNGLGAQAAGTATWLLGAPIVLAGHTLNIMLCLIALLAHGVRLNMLEFSNNAGVEWAGYPFQPFAKATVKEI